MAISITGGVIILVFKPFKMGDFITVAAGSGTVSAISIFYTTIVTPDNKNITIPNGTLANGDVTNYSVHDTRRVDLDFSVSYSSDINKVKEKLISMRRNLYGLETDEGKNAIITGELSASYQWSCDAVYILDEAEGDEDTENPLYLEY